MVTGKSTRKRKKRQAKKEESRRKRAEKKAKKRRLQSRAGKKHSEKEIRIGPNTRYGVCQQRLTGYGGLLVLVKFLDLVGFQEVFAAHYRRPMRTTRLGCYSMMMGIFMLLFVGFSRLHHMTYVREDAMICGILGVRRLPAVSTFWRYLASLNLVQGQALLKIMGILRRRVWHHLGYQPRRVRINMDTTPATVYGEIVGARKGYNPKHRGKKALRPVFCFLDGTREYLCGKQRKGQTISRKEVAAQIRSFRSYLPECVQRILVCADEEFTGWKSVEACLDEGFDFIFASETHQAPIPREGWYRWGDCEYNEYFHRAKGWKREVRYVVMRKPKRDAAEEPYLVEEMEYTYRGFATNLGLRPHNVVRIYDKRAAVETLIGEAQREGILAIPSRRFQSSYAFFQVAMFTYNLWRWIKMLAGHRETAAPDTRSNPERSPVERETIHTTRLRLLFTGARITSHGNRNQVSYAVHQAQASGIIDLLEDLDRRRAQIRTSDQLARASPCLSAC